MSTPKRKRARGLVVIPIFGVLFWVTALIASAIPGLLVLGVNVHGLGVASYAGDPGVALAPLSQQILNDISHDTAPGAAGDSATPTSSPAPVAATAPSATPRPAATTTASPTATPLPLPLPSATPLPSILTSPTPTPTPTPTPSPTPTKATISGQVTDDVTHLGIAAAQVTISSGGSTTTDGNGNFSFGVNAGTYTLTASATGYNSASQTVTVNGGQNLGVTIKLVSVTATGAIKGNVTNSVTAAAVVGAVITLSNGLSMVTDLNGAYSFAVVLYGTYSITASAPGYVTQTQSVTVKPGHITTLNFALAP